MYKIENKKIGQHLSDLIKTSKYKSTRQFCIAYLSLKYGTEPSQSDIQNMQNRVSQIVNGKKGIQIEDLPVFTELLHVSAEDILSAGTVLAPVSNRITNYSIALSHDQSEWDAFIKDAEKPFLNPDEYNKTVIDYAIEAGNYQFLIYLINNGYIWFVGDEKDVCYLGGFGAGTRIERRDFMHQDLLTYRMQEQDDLRYKMIYLAIENGNYEILDSMKAREIPLLYTLNYYHPWNLNNKKYEFTGNIELMIQSIARANKKVLSYYFTEFETEKTNTSLPGTFIFPFANQVLDALIKNKRTKESIFCLEKALEHNKKVLKDLQSIVDRSKTLIRQMFKDDKHYDEKTYTNEIWRDYYFFPDLGMVSIHMPIFLMKGEGFITNVVKVSAKSNNPDVQRLSEELNKTYNRFNTYLSKKEV